MNLVYLTTVGTWKQGVKSKKNNVNESHLLPDDKEYLSMLWDEIWEKAGRGEYTNYEMDAAGNRSIGMFGTGFFSFQNKTTNAHVQAFIKMCVDILPKTDDYEMFDRAAQVLTSSFQGMRAASASMVLHCLKPNTFPVLNSNMGNRNIFEVLGVDLVKKDSIETYIDNCRKIKAFRDQNFAYKNYRIFDIAAWKVKEYVINHPTGKFDSWEIINEDIARKNCDELFFENHSSGIPQDICWFFKVDGLQLGHKQELVLVYDGFEYDAYIQKESASPARTSMFWDSTLAEEFAPLANDGAQHALEFNRSGKNRYEVTFADASVVGRVWLIAWNKNNWYWDKFAEKCAATKAGETFVESWKCSNSNPQIGEEVFLIKLGELPRGFIGHGTVVRSIYEKPHYDAAKAAEGEMEKAIDVEFDRLINYEQDKFVSQEELIAECGAQHWSPQNSGIEIKPEVLPALRSLWGAVTKDTDEWWPGLSEYDPGISVQEYHGLFLNEKVVRRSWLDALYEMYMMPGHSGTCKQMGERYGYASSHYVSHLTSAASNIAKETNCAILPREENARFWPVLFQGKHTTDKNQGSYCWKMREPVVEAIEILIDEGVFDSKENGVMVQFDHNMILYGPPGTGKTYNSVCLFSTSKVRCC